MSVQQPGREGFFGVQMDTASSGSSQQTIQQLISGPRRMPDNREPHESNRRRSNTTEPAEHPPIESSPISPTSPTMELSMNPGGGCNRLVRLPRSTSSHLYYSNDDIQAKIVIPCLVFAQVILSAMIVYSSVTISSDPVYNKIQIVVQSLAFVATSIFVLLHRYKNSNKVIFELLFVFMGFLIVVGDWIISSKDMSSREIWPLGIILKNLMLCCRCRSKAITLTTTIIWIWIVLKSIERCYPYGLYSMTDSRDRVNISLFDFFQEICFKSLVFILDSLTSRLFLTSIEKTSQIISTDVAKSTEVLFSLASYDLRRTTTVDVILNKNLKSALLGLITRMRNIKPYLPQALFSEVNSNSSGGASINVVQHIGGIDLSGSQGTGTQSFQKGDWKSFRLTKKELSITSRQQTFRREVYDTVSLSTFGCRNSGSEESDGSCQTTKSDEQTPLSTNPLLMHDPRTYKKAKGVIVVLTLDQDPDIRNITAAKGTLDRFTEDCCTSVLLHRGYVERLTPGVITCSWGIWTFTANAPQLAIAASLHACSSLKAANYRVTAAVALGDCIGGIIGHADIIRSHFASGPPLVLCEYIASLASYQHLDVCSGPRVQNCIQYDFVCRPVDVLSGIPHYQKPQHIYEIRGPTEKVNTEEWMYTINVGKTGMEVYQEAYDALLTGKHTEARVLFQKHLSQLKEGDRDIVSRRYLAALEHHLHMTPRSLSKSLESCDPVRPPSSPVRPPSSPVTPLPIKARGCERGLFETHVSKRSMHNLNNPLPPLLDGSPSLPTPYHRPVCLRFIRFGGEDYDLTGSVRCDPVAVADLPHKTPDRRTGIILPELPSIPNKFN